MSNFIASRIARGLVGTLLISSGFVSITHAGPGPFTSEWDAASGLLPDQVSPPWPVFDNAEPEEPTLDGGVLRIETSANAENISYLQTEPQINVSLPFVVEARMRFVSGSSSSVARAPGFLGVTTGPSEGIGFFIGQDNIFLTTVGDVVGDSAIVDTDDAPHDYRIEIADDGTVAILYDGVPTLTGAVWTSNNNHGPLERVFWGEGSVLALGVLEWESVRHNALFPVVTTTVTTTSTTTSTTIAASICGDANADTVISATDALIILQVAVGQPLECLPERCDVDNSGALVATDALRVLQAAVGLPVELDCPQPVARLVARWRIPPAP